MKKTLYVSSAAIVVVALLAIHFYQPVKCYFSHLILFKKHSLYYPSCLVPSVHEKYISFMHMHHPDGSILVDTRSLKDIDDLFDEYSASGEYDFVKKTTVAINDEHREALYFREKGDNYVTMFVEKKGDPFTWGYLGPEENMEHFKALMSRFRVYPGE